MATTADTYSHLDYSSKITSADKIGKALNFGGNTEVKSEEVKDDDAAAIQQLLHKYGLNNAGELFAFIEKRLQSGVRKQRKSESEL
ncbi:MAG: hypothetical protein FWE84_03900 [Firmicutes bacterium]|nr:hypothetical protein [Bacillota bacterium]